MCMQVPGVPNTQPFPYSLIPTPSASISSACLIGSAPLCWGSPFPLSIFSMVSMPGLGRAQKAIVNPATECHSGTAAHEIIRESKSRIPDLSKIDKMKVGGCSLGWNLCNGKISGCAAPTESDQDASRKDCLEFLQLSLVDHIDGICLVEKRGLYDLVWCGG